MITASDMFTEKELIRALTSTDKIGSAASERFERNVFDSAFNYTSGYYVPPFISRSLCSNDSTFILTFRLMNEDGMPIYFDAMDIDILRLPAYIISKGLTYLQKKRKHTKDQEPYPEYTCTSKTANVSGTVTEVIFAPSKHNTVDKETLEIRGHDMPSSTAVHRAPMEVLLYIFDMAIEYVNAKKRYDEATPPKNRNPELFAGYDPAVLSDMADIAAQVRNFALISFHAEND